MVTQQKELYKNHLHSRYSTLTYQSVIIIPAEITFKQCH